MSRSEQLRYRELVTLAGLLSGLLLLGACGPDTQSSVETFETAASTCEAGPSSRSLTVDTDARTVGPSANALVSTPEQVWVVSSGNNTLAPVAEGPTIDVGDGRNPYDAAYDATDRQLYITNYLTDSVSVADPGTGQVVQEITHQSLDHPAGIAISDSYVYVSNTGYRTEGPYAPGSVTVIDRSTNHVLGEVSTAQRNPQFLSWVDTDAGPHLLVVDTGELAYDGSDFDVGPSAIEIWAETADPLTPVKTIAPLEEVSDDDIGAPGRAAVTADGSRAYFTSATAPVLFELDLETGEWIRGADDPIVLYEAQSDALDHAAMGPDGVLYISAFNHERLIMLDTRCNALIGSFDISTNDTLNAGPHAIAVTQDATDEIRGYIVGSISNSLIEFSLK